MIRFAAVTLALLAALAIAGCDGPSDYDASDANAQCAPHGGVLSVDTYGGHLVVCGDKHAYVQDQHAGDR